MSIYTISTPINQVTADADGPRKEAIVYFRLSNQYAKSGILNDSLKVLTFWYDVMFVILPIFFNWTSIVDINKISDLMLIESMF